MPSLKAWAADADDDDVNTEPRTNLKLLGKEVVVGVAGRTLTEWWGERPMALTLLPPPPPAPVAVDTDPLELVDEALEWEWWCWCWWMERMDETELDVDLRPRRPCWWPADERRTVRGVRGEGERDWRL
jgi:hypothetical protein